LKELENLPEKHSGRPRITAGLQAVNTVDPEAHEGGEKEDVGNARTKSSIVDSLDIRVARGKDDSASHEERNSSAEDEPERFRPNLANDAAQLRKTLEKRAEARKGKPRPWCCQNDTTNEKREESGVGQYN
jgi:hypothetical protein